MEGKRPVSVAVMAQHDPDLDLTQVQMRLVDAAILPIIGEHPGVKLFVNSGGAFGHGGFASHAGASGRKTQADLYGGLLPSSDIGLSGKDPRKPARAGTYMARFAAKQLVAQGVAGNVLMSVGYSMGQPEPIFIEARSGTGEDLSALVKKQFDFRPDAVVERLDLARPIYKDLATYGQFGREGVGWESLDKKEGGV